MKIFFKVRNMWTRFVFLVRGTWIKVFRKSEIGEWEFVKGQKHKKHFQSFSPKSGKQEQDFFFQNSVACESDFFLKRWRTHKHNFFGILGWYLNRSFKSLRRIKKLVNNRTGIGFSSDRDVRIGFGDDWVHFLLLFFPFPLQLIFLDLVRNVYFS